MHGHSPSTTAETDEAALAALFRGDSEMAQLMRTFDWRTSPLGPPQQWPQSLKTAVSIMLTSQQPIWIGWGPELVYLYNDAYHSIIGGKHPWALGRPTSEVWREIWSDIAPLLDQALHHAGTYVESQLLIMERNGYPEETYYTFSYSPIPNEQGVVTGIFCANTDDTQRVIGERQLTLLRELATRTAEARNWQQACEQSVAALATDLHDMPFAMLYACSDKGGCDDDVPRLIASSGIDASHYAAPTLLDEGMWPFEEAMRRNEAVVVENLATRIPDALPMGAWSRSPHSAVVLPIMQSSEGAHSGVLIVGLNPFRLFDAQYAGFLNLVAGQIGAAIANAEAYEQERRRAEALAEIDRAKTTFFSNVSHEFRTPLTLMLNPLEEVLTNDVKDGDANHALIEMAHRNGLRLLKLVNSLLDFSRLEAGRMQPDFAAVDLAAFTARIAATFRPTIERAGLTLQVECPPLQERVYVDVDMWEKVVLNLLSNAFKYTPQGEILLSLRTTEGVVELTVRDTGVGIPSEHLSRIFERFHRVENAGGRSIEGSGIGLALVQELVKLHEGEITVESEPGRGSAFTVRLPFGRRQLDVRHLDARYLDPLPEEVTLHANAYVWEAASWLSSHDTNEAHEELWSANAGASADAVTTHQRDEGWHVLLADDNPDMRAYVERLLRVAGYSVEAVSDGATALAAARARRPELLLTDVMMPGMDGFALLNAIRADASLQDLPVILLSARAGEEARIEGLTAGADDYLIKPFSARELLARVEANVKLAEMRQDRARMLREEAHILEQLNRVGTAIAAEIDLERTVQVVTDAATELSGAAFGSFFYNVIDERGEAYTLYTLSGVAREAFAKFPMPRNTAVFAPTFKGEGVVRSADITQDPRYGRNAPHFGMPTGHLPLRSYLAVPVLARNGEVYGGLFFGHPEVDVFDARAERIVCAIALQAAIAIEKARLYRSAQEEIERRIATEAALRDSEQSLERKVRERTRELAQANVNLLHEAAERVRTEGLFRLLIEGVHDYAIYLLDPDGRVVSWNTGAERIKGYQASEIIGEHFSRFYTDEDLAADTPAQALRIAASVGPYEAEGWRQRKDGSRFFANAVINAVRDSSGKLLGYAKVTRDITERKEAQEALRLAQEQLAHAQKMEGIGQLTGGVAHDFNNLLTVIIGNLDTIQRAIRAGNTSLERIERAAGSAMSGAQRAAALTQRLLAFARRQPLDPKPVNVNRLVMSMSELLRQTLGEQIAIETVLGGGLWHALIDAGQLETSIINLAVNARHAMPAGGRLTIETANTYLDERYAGTQTEVVPGQYVMICVSDTGHGMSSEVLSRAFEPFFTTKEIGQGTGLGLSQVYGFVKQSGGHVRIYSEFEQGTTVKLYLPRLLSARDLDEKNTLDSSAPAGTGEIILVVEDEAEVRAYTCSILSELGYTVVEADSGALALKLLEVRDDIDLLFTDVGLPGGMNGRQLADAARRVRPTLKVLFTTGYARNAIVHEGRLDPGVLLITKPFSFSALATKLRTVLDADEGQARILLLEDDSHLLRRATHWLEDMSYKVEVTSTATDAMNRARLLHGAFEAAIIDVDLPDNSGVRLVRELRKLYPALPIVVISVQSATEFGEGVVQIGSPYTREELIAVLARESVALM